MRIARGTIQEELKPLSSLKTARECAQVCYDVVQCHHWVWTYPKILHRDISQGNIMARVKDGVTYRGVLNDWDLASWVGRLEQGPTSQFRTGTKPYMAHEQQRSKWKGPHRYRHDLESVFYVMTLFTFLYSKPSEKSTIFEEWYQKDDEYLGVRKHALIGEPEWDPPVTTFFTGFHSWLHKIHIYFFDGFTLQKTQRRIADQRTDEDESDEVWILLERKGFDEDTLGGYVSFESTTGQHWTRMILHASRVCRT
ncbi:hypothetical protein C8R42DRAFT_713753 [Lentinula raphanica]|nr:hypothetical protein C8R42DRAFT_713753 [Lentinula raphanica]